jgi:hypothetical protein
MQASMNLPIIREGAESAEMMRQNQTFDEKLHKAENTSGI